MTDLFPTIGNADWATSLRVARTAPNAVSQQVRIKAGWPESLDFSVLATRRSDQADYMLSFEADVCAYAEHRSDLPELHAQLCGRSYDCVAASLRAAGFTVELWAPPAS